jgi:transcription antitermination protein NusB
MLRPETKARARALQVLYSMEVGSGLELVDAVTRMAHLTGPDPKVYDRAESLARAVLADRERLDERAADAADNWRLDRIAAVERNILRIGIYELLTEEVPPKVAIDEAVQLAHWFGGAKAPAFVNGVLDRVAHSLGRL